MYENDPNGPQAPVRTANRFDRETSSGFGWLPIAIVAALLLAVFLLIPKNDPRAPSVTERTSIELPNTPAPPAYPAPPAAPTTPPQ